MSRPYYGKMQCCHFFKQKRVYQINIKIMAFLGPVFFKVALCAYFLSVTFRQVAYAVITRRVANIVVKQKNKVRFSLVRTFSKESRYVPFGTQFMYNLRKKIPTKFRKISFVKMNTSAFFFWQNLFFLGKAFMIYVRCIRFYADSLNN